MSFSPADVKKLREETGAGIMDCKKALEEAKGSYDKARDIVRAKGMLRAEKKADRETKEGYVASYTHSNNKIGVLVEILCETDFVARNDEFQVMARDVAMHIAAMKPADVTELLSQEFIRDGSRTIEQLVKELSGKIGEKFVINRFIRFQIGE